MKTKPRSMIGVWGEKIDWTKRVKAVCKPCWELKYCPYGPLVETFPLGDTGDKRTCRIFGHVCPVFDVAEPFTETKELRNISRRIPRPVQIRVLKRDNQVCRKCGKPVRDDDIQFDHVIPWSKGGPSEEHNIQLLCSSCNGKKRNSFEEEYLIETLGDHIVEPVGVGILEPLFYLAELRHEFRTNENRLPLPADIAKDLPDGKDEAFEQGAADLIQHLEEFFNSPRPEEIREDLFQALRRRWGFVDGKLTYLRSVAAHCEVDVDELLQTEIQLVERLGFRVSLTKTDRTKWLRS